MTTLPKSSKEIGKVLRKIQKKLHMANFHDNTAKKQSKNLKSFEKVAKESYAWPISMTTLPKSNKKIGS
jgi:hypothetical protein